MKLKPDWFLLGMIASTALAWLAPGPGAAGGWLHPELLTKAGVALIFFLHGVALSFGAMRAGVLNWRLHALVQTFTFLVFPLLGFALSAGLDGHVAPELKLGVFYLCALPSTVSSSPSALPIATPSRRSPAATPCRSSSRWRRGRRCAEALSAAGQTPAVLNATSRGGRPEGPPAPCRA